MPKEYNPAAGGKSGGDTHIHQQFAIPPSMPQSSQSQVDYHAGMGVQRALRRFA